MIIAERPEGQRDDYLFIESEGEHFKVLHELRQEGTALWLVLSIAPVDQDGKAMRINDVPDVMYHTHHLTETELSAPDFDLDKRISAIIASLVAAKGREIAARRSMASLADRWRAGNITIAQDAPND
jgi:hypothetical protein